MKKMIYLFAATIFLASCAKNDKPHGDDKAAANAARVQEFYDQVMNAHNTALVDSFCTTDFLDHQADPRYPKGTEGLKMAFNDFFAGFPDLHVKTNFMKAWGDTVMAHFTMTGTNTGSMAGMPATNKSMSIDGVDIVVVNGRKAIEHWGYQEEMKMMTQLGMMGGPGDSAMTKK